MLAVIVPSTGHHCPITGHLCPQRWPSLSSSCLQCLVPPIPRCPALFTPVGRTSMSTSMPPASHGAEPEVSTCADPGALDPQGPALVLEEPRADASPTFTARAAGTHSRGHPGCQDAFPELLEPCRLSLGVLRDWGSDRSLDLRQCTGTSLAHLPAALCSPVFPARL